MKRNMKAALAGTASATLVGAVIMSGYTPFVQTANAQDAGAPATDGGTFTLRAADLYETVSRVQGEFTYSQDTVTPTDEMFNLFGTAVTGMCAKPADSTFEENVANYYVNVGGDIKEAYTVNLEDLQDQAQEKILVCACGMGAATANVQAKGIDLADIVSLADGLDEANLLEVTGSDGYVAKLPLRYALDNEAMVVYQVNGENLPTATQFWVPNTVAKYFVRDVVDIQVLHTDEVPEVEGRDAELSAEVNITNRLASAVVPAGEAVAFEGYADDLGSPIAALEFSLDGGENWTSYEVKATTDRWVHWNFSYTPEKAGTYELTVRAVTEDGAVSPLAATAVFTAV